MLAFITTLGRPCGSDDYGRRESLLRDTLASLCQQTCEDFMILVVGHQRPSFMLSDRVRFIEVDYLPSSELATGQPGMAPFLWDTATKNGIGLAAARTLGAEYVMFVEAGDFVHRDVAAHVRRHADSPGWVLKRGWIYSQRRNAYAPRRRLFRICGTSFILPVAAYAVPDWLTVSSSQTEVAHAFGVDALEQVIGAHRHALQWWADRGRRLQPLPFPGAVHLVDTGENAGSRLRGPGLPYQPFLWDDFAIPWPSRRRLASWWSAVGLPAWTPDRPPRRPSFLPWSPQLTRRR